MTKNKAREFWVQAIWRHIIKPPENANPEFICNHCGRSWPGQLCDYCAKNIVTKIELARTKEALARAKSYIHHDYMIENIEAIERGEA